ncbi:MAG TPA: hypothetical protein VE983_03205 [Solirubrobacteraceae bacterium]|nr:hypothetical protein [Solirubrobacteraceae bacterium]
MEVGVWLRAVVRVERVLRGLRLDRRVAVERPDRWLAVERLDRWLAVERLPAGLRRAEVELDGRCPPLWLFVVAMVSLSS